MASLEVVLDGAVLGEGVVEVVFFVAWQPNKNNSESRSRRMVIVLWTDAIEDIFIDRAT